MITTSRGVNRIYTTSFDRKIKVCVKLNINNLPFFSHQVDATSWFSKPEKKVKMWNYKKISLQGNAGPSQETALCRTREGLARDGEASTQGIDTIWSHELQTSQYFELLFDQ